MSEACEFFLFNQSGNSISLSLINAVYILSYNQSNVMSPNSASSDWNGIYGTNSATPLVSGDTFFVEVTCNPSNPITATFSGITVPAGNPASMELYFFAPSGSNYTSPYQASLVVASGGEFQETITGGSGVP